MSLVSIIKDLYEITRPGGRANTSTGSVSGSLAEQIEYIADNSGGGGGSFLTSPLAARAKTCQTRVLAQAPQRLPMPYSTKS